jgi:hypothetical protein
VTTSPIRWGKGRQDQCLQWLDVELTAAQSARQTLEARWRDWLEQYRAPAIQPTKDFPFAGAANYVLPITATDVDQLYAKEMQTIFAPDNLWTLQALNEGWVDAAKPLQDGMTWLDRNALHMWDVCKRVKLEKFKLGTGIYKTGWLYEQRPIWTYDQYGKQVRGKKTVGRPFVDHVRLNDFIIPPYAYAIQPDHQGGAPWVAERLRMDTDRFRSLARSSEPFLPGISTDAVNAVLKFIEGADTEYDTKVQDMDFVKRGTVISTEQDFDTDKSNIGQGSIRRAVARDIELWEIHARFPTGGIGGADDPARDTQGDNDSQDDIVVWYHQPTRQFVRAVFNPYHHGRRPYDVERMFPGDGFYGIGVCEQKEMFQRGGSELMNFMFDNVLLGNSIGIAAKAGANIAPGEPIYPGKIWITEGDVRQDLQPFQLGTVRSDLPALIQMFGQIGERRTGISDIQLGNMQNLPGRTPATTMLSLLQEGNRRPDFAIKDSRYEGLAVVGLRIIQLMQQYVGSPVDVGGKTLLRLMVQSLGMPEGLHAAQKLTMPNESAELGLGVSITATSGSANKEVERQNMVALLQLAGQLTPQFIQLISVAQQAQGTPVGMVALQSALGLQQLYRRTLEQYDVRNIEDVAPDIEKDTQPLQAPSGTPAGPLAGAGGLVGPTGGTPQLAGVLQALGIGG